MKHATVTDIARAGKLSLQPGPPELTVLGYTFKDDPDITHFILRPHHGPQGEIKEEQTFLQEIAGDYPMSEMYEQDGTKYRLSPNPLRFRINPEWVNADPADTVRFAFHPGAFRQWHENDRADALALAAHSISTENLH